MSGEGVKKLGSRPRRRGLFVVGFGQGRETEGNRGKQNGREHRNIYCHLFAPPVPGGGRERAAASPAWWELCQAGEEAWATEEDGRGDAAPCGSSGESD